MDWAHADVYPFCALVGQERLKRALLLAAICPSIGGLLVRGQRGTAKSTAVRALAVLLPELDVVAGCPFNCDPAGPLCPECEARVATGSGLSVARQRVRVVDLPLGATEDRVAGSLDFERAVKEGVRRLQPGLLAAAHRGILYIDEVNLLDDYLVDLILDAAAMGWNRVEREGVSYSHPARFILVGTMNPEEGELRPQLLDRFGMCVEVEALAEPAQRVRLMRLRAGFENDPEAFLAEHQAAQKALAARIARAGEALPFVTMGHEALRLCSRLAAEAHVAGLRADIAMRKAAAAMASLEGRPEATEQDVIEAAELVLLHRRRTPPQARPKQPGQQEQGPPTEDNHHPEQADTQPPPPASDRGHEETPPPVMDPPEGGPLERLGLAPQLRITPAGEPFQTRRIELSRDRLIRTGSGRRTRSRTSCKMGRYVKSTANRRHDDLALDATLRAAAPHQRRRNRPGLAVAIEAADIREKIREKRVGSLVVFVVDASGSMGAGQRMGATKGAILSLLLDAYQKRDRVALVAFRGEGADVLLPPTGSIELGHRLLEELPTGGRTPLADGLALGYQVIERQLRKDPRTLPLLVLVSDGRANVSREGGKPVAEALEVAEAVGEDARVRSIVVDVERAGLLSLGLARELAERLRAGYFPIDDLKAETLAQVVREGGRGPAG